MLMHRFPHLRKLLQSNLQTDDHNIMQKNNNLKKDIEIEGLGHYGSEKDDFASEDLAVIDPFKLTEDLKKWTVKYKPTTSSLKDWLGIIYKYGFKLPKDAWKVTAENR